MRIKYTKIEPDLVRQNRNFFKNHVKKAFIAWCAYEGYFDGLLSRAEIDKAKMGILPKDLNVHHKIPISGSTDLFVNDFSNLSIIHKDTHEFINKYIYAPQLRHLSDKPYGSEIQIDVPNYEYVDRDGIRKEKTLEIDTFYKRWDYER